MIVDAWPQPEVFRSGTPVDSKRIVAANPLTHVHKIREDLRRTSKMSGHLDGAQRPIE